MEYREDGNGVRSWYLCGGLGHTTDSDTGLIYMRARYYDPTIGRFVSEDPAADGTHWYAYCTGSPVNMTDATGKCAVLLGLALLGFICTLIGGLLAFAGLCGVPVANGYRKWAAGYR